MASKGKYDGIVGNLPRDLEESTYQEQINVKKTAIMTEWREQHQGLAPTAAELAAAYVENREEKEDMEEELKTIQLQLTAIEQLLVERYEQEGLRRCSLSDGADVGVQLEPTAKVIDRAIFRNWCVANGLEDQLMLPWMTTNAITKQRLLEGQPEPDGVQAHCRAKIVLRRG